MTRIHLVLTDDWELRGDGAGNIEALQFGTMPKLSDLLEAQGLRASFNVEVMQQLEHLRQGKQDAELATRAEGWKRHVQDAYRRGHDVQLHIHPQWSRAEYRDGRWSLGGSWSILD